MTQVLFTDPLPQQPSKGGYPYTLTRAIELKSTRGETTILSMSASYLFETGEARIDFVKASTVGIGGNESHHYNIEEARQVIAEYDRWLAELTPTEYKVMQM